MKLSDYSSTVQGWVQEVLDNCETNAQLVLSRCSDIIDCGRKTDDDGLIGFGKFYEGTVYYALNDGAHFFETMTDALTYLDRAEEGELVVRCYNYLGIGAMGRGNLPIALDYYINGEKNAGLYELPMCRAMILINMGILYMECGHYQDAEKAYRQAYKILAEHPQENESKRYRCSYYGNLAECLLQQGRLSEVQKCLDHIHMHLWEEADLLDRIFISCVEVLYYHKTGDTEKCLACADYINGEIPDNLTVLDIFNNLYRCCLVLLEMGQDEAFRRIVDVVEPQVVSFDIINLQLKVISLKMKYYKGHGQMDDYYEAAARFCEMSERNEGETENMLSNLITLRKNLERMREARITAERENALLQERSEHDPLTHMANRFLLDSYVEDLFVRAREGRIPIAMEMLDIDYFKEYNDNYGHQAGDHCLESVGQTIITFAEERNAFCARYGGDEFVVVYENLTRGEALADARELRRRILALDMEHRYSKAVPVVTISQGVCWGYVEEKVGRWDFLHAADMFLYRVKKFSRNNYCVGGLDETEDVSVGGGDAAEKNQTGLEQDKNGNSEI